MQGRHHFTHLLIFIVTTGIAIAATDIYTPGLPNLVDHFQTTSLWVRLTIGVYLLFLSFSSLIFGPLADIIGRRPVLLGGFLFFTLGSLGCALAPTIGWLLGARALQGTAAGALNVVVLVIIQDLYSPKMATKKFAQAGMAIVCVPILSQFLGGRLVTYFGWEYCFLVIASLGSILFIGCYCFISETKRTTGLTPHSLNQVLKNYTHILGHKRAMAVFLSMPLLLGGLWGFRAVMPFFLIEVKGILPKHFWYYMSTIVIGLFVGGWYTQRFVSKWGVERILRQGTTLALIGPFFLTLLYISHLDTPFMTSLSMLPYTFALAMTLSTSATKGMAYFEGIEGTTSAVFTSLRMAAAGFGGIIGGMLQVDSLKGVTGLLWVCAILAFLLVFYTSQAEYKEKKEFQLNVEKGE